MNRDGLYMWESHGKIMLLPFDKPENLSTTFDKAKDSDKLTNPTDDSITTICQCNYFFVIPQQP